MNEVIPVLKPLISTKQGISSLRNDGGKLRVAVLGSTGSIGTQTLDVLAAWSERFEVVGLSAGQNAILLYQQASQWPIQQVVLGDANSKNQFELLGNTSVAAEEGALGLETLVADLDYDILVVGLVGSIGLKPTLIALERGKTVLTANKETFVAAGHLIAPYLDQIIPLDSEHCALHQCLKGAPPESVKNLILTASGGPFRTWPQEKLAQVTPQQALKHPNWVMGKRISIDSATMMNKGLEVIEAHWLFQQPYENIEIVVHPQSIVHSGVCFRDGNILMQLGTADMRLPIQYGLTYPDRLTSPFPQSVMDFKALSQLDFEPPDPKRFPCYQLAYEAGQMGPGATCALNAADEILVQAFLDESIGFLDIPHLLEQVLSQYQHEWPSMKEPSVQPNLETILEIDAWARQVAKTLSEKLFLKV